MRYDQSNTDLSAFLTKQEVILLDGAMGTQLGLRGLVMGGPSNLTDPDQIAENKAKWGYSE